MAKITTTLVSNALIAMGQSQAHIAKKAKITSASLVIWHPIRNVLPATNPFMRNIQHLKGKRTTALVFVVQLAPNQSPGPTDAGVVIGLRFAWNAKKQSGAGAQRVVNQFWAPIWTLVMRYFTMNASSVWIARRPYQVRISKEGTIICASRVRIRERRSVDAAANPSGQSIPRSKVWHSTMNAFFVPCADVT